MNKRKVLFLTLIFIVSSCASWRTQWKTDKKELKFPTNAIECWDIGKCWDYEKRKCIKC